MLFSPLDCTYFLERGVYMNLAVLKNEEKQMNLIMFIFMDIIPVVAFVYVLLFNGGQARDALSLSLIGGSLLLKFCKYIGDEGGGGTDFDDRQIIIRHRHK